jgi:hypothetical protein
MSITIQCVQLATLCFFFGFSFKNRDEKEEMKKCKHTKQKERENGIEIVVSSFIHHKART